MLRDAWRWQNMLMVPGGVNRNASHRKILITQCEKNSNKQRKHSSQGLTVQLFLTNHISEQTAAHCNDKRCCAERTIQSEPQPKKCSRNRKSQCFTQCIGSPGAIEKQENSRDQR